LALGRPGFNRGPRPPFKKKEAEHYINELIRAVEVRLVGDNVEVGVYALKDALAIAEDLELDLVEISPNAVPPVCKVVDYNSTTRVVRYYQDISTGYTVFGNAENVVGGTSGATGTISTKGNPEVQPDSGDILYIENRRAINRASDQIEDIKLIVEF
jgi:hypothetical protein